MILGEAVVAVQSATSPSAWLVVPSHKEGNLGLGKAWVAPVLLFPGRLEQLDKDPVCFSHCGLSVFGYQCPAVRQQEQHSKSFAYFWHWELWREASRGLCCSLSSALGAQQLSGQRSSPSPCLPLTPGTSEWETVGVQLKATLSLPVYGRGGRSCLHAFSRTVWPWCPKAQQPFIQLWFFWSPGRVDRGKFNLLGEPLLCNVTVDREIKWKDNRNAVPSFSWGAPSVHSNPTRSQIFICCCVSG